MRNLKSLFKVAVVLFCFVLTISACTKTEEESMENGKNTKAVNYKMVSEDFDIEGTSAKVETSYPSFNDYPVLNEIVKAKVNAIKADFTAQSEQVLKAYADAKMEKEPGMEFIISVGDIIESEGYVGFMISSYSFTGGAHGITRLDAVNFDTKEMKEISLEDVLKPLNADWLAKLSEACISELINKPEGESFSDEETIRSGAGQDASNFKNFNILDDKLVIVFEQYQVAPYSAGMPEVIIPLSLFK